MATQPKPREPMTFSGQRDRKVLDSWVFAMNRYLKLTGAKEELWVELASTYLDGTANTWYEGWYPATFERVLASKAESTSRHAISIPWDVFIQALYRSFELPNHHQHL